MRGPGSSLYGADAVGGVVQIITRRGSGAPQFAAHAAVGSYASSEADAFASGATQGFDYAASVSREASDGVSAVKPGDTFGLFNPDRDGFKRSSIQLRGGFSFAPGQRIGASIVDSRLRSQYDGDQFVDIFNRMVGYYPGSTPQHPQRLVGMNWPAPVGRAPLVEVLATPATDASAARI